MVSNYLPSLDNKRKLTEQQTSFLSALATDARGDINKALDIAGYKPGASYSVINSLKDEIIDVATKILAKSAPQASTKLVEILESDDPIPQVNAKLQAAQTLLDRVGVSKRDKLDVTHSSGSGIFILPEKKAIIEAEDVEVIDEKKE
jgi:glycerate-2-kinase